MKEAWSGMAFHCTPYKDTGTSVVGQTEDIQMLLDDQLMKVQAMNASPFVKAFKSETVQWEKILSSMQVRAAAIWFRTCTCFQAGFGPSHFFSHISGAAG